MKMEIEIEMNTKNRPKTLWRIEEQKNLFMTSRLLMPFIVLVLASPYCFAIAGSPPSQVGQSVTSVSVDAPKASEKFETTVALDYETQIAKEPNREKTVDLNLTIFPTYVLTPKMQLMAKTIITQHQINEKSSTKFETEMSDTLIGLVGSSFEFPGPTSLGHGLAIILPTNKTSATVDRLKGTIRLSNGFDTKWGPASLRYRLGIQRSAHEYTVNAEGSPNIEWALRNSLEVNIEFTDKFSAKYSGLYIQGRTYRGFERQTFTSDVSLEYDYTPAFHLTGGLSNKGSALAANGRDSNLKFYDENVSTWSLGIEYVF